MKYRKVNLDAFSVVGVKKFASKENGENFINIPQMWADFPVDDLNKLRELSNLEPSGVMGVCAGYYSPRPHSGSSLQNHQGGLTIFASCVGNRVQLGKAFTPVFDLKNPDTLNLVLNTLNVRSEALLSGGTFSSERNVYRPMYFHYHAFRSG